MHRFSQKYKVFGLHQFAPKAWQHTHNITGDMVFDESIERSRNRSVPDKILTHVASGSYRSGYRGYGGISGDE